MSSSLSTVTIQKKKIDVDQRMAAKALLLAHFPGALNGGQLIIHFMPGRTPVFIELQEREDHLAQQLRKTG